MTMGLVNNLVHLGKAAAMQGPWECCQCCQYPIPIPNPSTPFVYAKASTFVKASTFAKATVDKSADREAAARKGGDEAAGVENPS